MPRENDPECSAFSLLRIPEIMAMNVMLLDAHIQLFNHNDEIQQPEVIREHHRQRQNPMDIYSNEEFVRRYRFTKDTTTFLVDLVREELERPTLRSCSLPVVLQVCIALQFYATGTFQHTVGDTLNISQSSVSKIVKAVSVALARKREQFIKFDTNNMHGRKQDFYELAEFPNCIGAVDCTHIKISKLQEDPELYINRKGFYSINVQAICDAKLKFTDVVARWPGSVHDSRVFNQSAIKESFERGDRDGVLLGDAYI